MVPLMARVSHIIDYMHTTSLPTLTIRNVQAHPHLVSKTSKALKRLFRYRILEHVYEDMQDEAYEVYVIMRNRRIQCSAEWYACFEQWSPLQWDVVEVVMKNVYPLALSEALEELQEEAGEWFDDIRQVALDFSETLDLSEMFLRKNDLS